MAAPSQVRTALTDTSKVVQAKGDNASGTSTAPSANPSNTGGSQSGSGAGSGQTPGGNQDGSSGKNTGGSGNSGSSGESQTPDTPVAAKPKFKFYHADASYNIRTGRATIREVYPGCHVVGWIGMENSTLTFTNIDGGQSGGTRLVQIHYICAGGSRDAYLSVNGGPATKMTLPPTGKVNLIAIITHTAIEQGLQKWDDFSFDFKVSLDGFVPGRKNTVTISNPDGWSADFWRIGVEQK